MKEKRTKSEATPIKDVLKQVVQKIDERTKISEDEMLKVWNRTVGTKAGRHSRPVALRKKNLKIFVENPGWIQELSMNKRGILKKLQSHFGKDKITDLRFKTGEM